MGYYLQLYTELVQITPTSSTGKFTCGELQGSILCPLLFSPPYKLLNYNGSFHIYADYTQLLSEIFDSDLSFEDQVRTLVQSSYCQFRDIYEIMSFSDADFGKVIHAFVSSWLDDCNSLFSSLVLPINLLFTACSELLLGS